MGKRRDTSRKGAALEVRLTPDDRTVAPPEGRRRRLAEGREEAGSDERRARRVPRSNGNHAAPRKVDAADPGRGEKQRKGVGLLRLIYWGIVLALWMAILLAGMFAWVAFTPRALFATSPKFQPSP